MFTLHYYHSVCHMIETLKRWRKVSPTDTFYYDREIPKLEKLKENMEEIMNSPLYKVMCED